MPDMSKQVSYEVTNRSIYALDDYLDIVVESDNNSRRLTFSVPRYYDEVDLSTKDVVVRFVNAVGQYDEYKVMDLTAEEEYVKFTWMISDKVVLQCGEAEFDILFWDENGYKWHTKPAKLKIEHGLLEADYVASGETSDLYAQWRIEAKENLRLTVEAKDAAELAEANAKDSETKAKASEDAALASQNAAKQSEDNAKTSETNAKASEEAALASQNAAKDSEDKAKASEDAALDSQNAAKTSEDNAKASETAAKTSETNAKQSEDNAKASETNAATSEANAEKSEVNALTSEKAAKVSETNAKNSEDAAKTSETNAGDSATLSESWAVGGTGTRTGEDNDNAKYYADVARSIAQGALGYYTTPEALKAAHPTGQIGEWAIVGSTDSIWVWDDETNDFVNSHQQTDLSNYYTKTQADQKLSDTLADYYTKVQSDEITSKIAPMYTATYSVTDWADASEEEQANGYLFKQTVALTKDVATSPDVTEDSQFMTVGAFTSTGVAATDESLMEALGIINSGYTVSGANQVVTLVTEKPTVDIPVKWAIKG